MMITNKDAIKIMELLHEANPSTYQAQIDASEMTIGERRKLNALDIYVVLDWAREALEKQIPKEPIREEPSQGQFVYYCPECYEYEGHKDWKNKLIFDQEYCDCCGQKIDWSGEEG